MSENRSLPLFGHSSSLVDLISFHLSSSRPKFPLPKDGDGFLRSSGLGKMCAREEVLAAIHQISRDDAVSADMQLTFSLGTAMHRELQNDILPALGALKGAWQCVRCCKTHGGLDAEGKFKPENMILRPSICAGCGAAGSLQYEELHFLLPEFIIKGHPDGFVQIPGKDELMLFEAKSISSGQVEKLKVKTKPIPEHVLQVQCYMWFTGLQTACILYWEKGAYGVKALTEHFVQRDAKAIEELKATLLGIRAAIRSEGPLPARVCATATSSRAKTCQLRKQCFPELQTVTELYNDPNLPF